MKKRTYGWRPDKPDFRDLEFMAPQHLHPAALPTAVDLRSSCPPVLDQGDLGSCTANAIAEAIEFDRLKQKLPAWTPSRLFIYYNERVIEGTTKEDAGAEIRDGMKTVNKLGAPPETIWPYVVSKFAKKPTAKAYTEGAKHPSITYKRLDSGADSLRLNTFRSCLAGGYPFVGGFTVYESFESAQVAKTGKVPMPSPSESVLGGHAILIIGYDDALSEFLVRNSWGKSWGMEGNFTIPYDYFLNSNLSSDFWNITVVK